MYATGIGKRQSCFAWATTVLAGALAAALLAGPAMTAEGAKIGIDARHAYGGAAESLATGAGFDDFRSVITSSGHTLVPLASFQADDLSGLRALVLNQPYTQNGSGYSAAEINDIHAFVSAGGGLFVHGEGGTGSDELADNLNALVAPYGVTYAPAASDPVGRTITAFVAHPVTAGVSSIGVDFHRQLTAIAAPAVDLTVYSGADNVLAVVNGGGGGGNVAFVTDSSMWCDAHVGSDRFLSFGDNQRLLQNIIAFIVVPEPSACALMAAGGVFAFAFIGMRQLGGGFQKKSQQTGSLR